LAFERLSGNYKTNPNSISGGLLKDWRCGWAATALVFLPEPQGQGALRGVLQNEPKESWWRLAQSSPAAADSGTRARVLNTIDLTTGKRLVI
jgi:hypothetical protein